MQRAGQEWPARFLFARKVRLCFGFPQGYFELHLQPFAPSVLKAAARTPLPASGGFMQKYSAAIAVRQGRRRSPHGRTIAVSGKGCAVTCRAVRPPRTHKAHGHTPSAATAPGRVPSTSQALTRCGWAHEEPPDAAGAPGPLWCWLRPGRRVRGRCRLSGPSRP